MPGATSHLGLLVRPILLVELVFCSEHGTIRVDLVMER
jgi:hypothetical protein